MRLKETAAVFSEAGKMGEVERGGHVSTVFRTSGLLKTEPIKIPLKENAQPYVAQTAGCVTLMLIPLVKKELHSLESSE